jgi:hypothetical protein
MKIFPTLTAIVATAYIGLGSTSSLIADEQKEKYLPSFLPQNCAEEVRSLFSMVNEDGGRICRKRNGKSILSIDLPKRYIDSSSCGELYVIENQKGKASKITKFFILDTLGDPSLGRIEVSFGSYSCQKLISVLDNALSLDNYNSKIHDKAEKKLCTYVHQMIRQLDNEKGKRTKKKVADEKEQLDLLK